MLRIKLLASAAALSLAACGGGATESAPEGTTPASTETTAPVETAEPTSGFAELEGVAGDYSLEVTHAYLAAYVGHGNGLSRYQISFTDIDADLSFDPAAPETASISFSVNTAGVQTNYPGDYKGTHQNSAHDSWNDDIANDGKWLNSTEFGTASFTSTSATRTGDNTGTVTGDLTLLGQTGTVTFDVTYNGNGKSRRSEAALLGFDATTTINRSEWGMGAFIPVVSDDVRLDFSGEFIQDLAE